MKDYDENPEGIWNSEIFGRKLSEVVNDGIRAKLFLLPENVQYKFRESLEKVVNKGDRRHRSLSFSKHKSIFIRRYFFFYKFPVPA